MLNAYRVSDGTLIPANQALGLQDVEARAIAFHLPFHVAIDFALGRLGCCGVVPLLLSLHSVTPALRAEGWPAPGMRASWRAVIVDSAMCCCRRWRSGDSRIQSAVLGGHAWLCPRSPRACTMFAPCSAGNPAGSARDRSRTASLDQDSMDHAVDRHSHASDDVAGAAARGALLRARMTHGHPSLGGGCRVTRSG